MGNISQNQSRECQINPHEWKVQQAHQRTSYINKVSGDQFYLIVKRNEKQQTQRFKQRSSFTFQNTPRFIIHSIKNNNISILVEDSTLQIYDLLNTFTNSDTAQLMTLRTLLKVLLNLKNKYGCFYFTSNMVRVRQSNSLMVWINQKFEECKVQFPLPSNQGEEVMVDLACKFFQKYLPNQKLPLKLSSIQQAISRTEEVIKKGCFKNHKINHQPINLLNYSPNIALNSYPHKFYQASSQNQPFPQNESHLKYYYRSGTMKLDNASKYSQQTVNLRYNNCYQSPPSKVLSSEYSPRGYKDHTRIKSIHNVQKQTIPTNYNLQVKRYQIDEGGVKSAQRIKSLNTIKKQSISKNYNSNLQVKKCQLDESLKVSINNSEKKNRFSGKVETTESNQNVQIVHKRSGTEIFSSRNTISLERESLPSPIRRNLRNQLYQLLKQ